MAAALAPIALFAYNRPAHLRRVLDALAANPAAAHSELYIFSDAAKDAGSERSVAQVRSIIADAAGFARVVPVLRDCNLGLARSIIDGASRLCASHGRVIVVEDDLVVSQHFLAYMNAALSEYANDDRVASIHAYVYPVKSPLPETFFLRGADCWGWGTWQRAWNIFEPDGALLRDRIVKAGLASRFDFDGSYHYMAMLEDQIAGKNDSWAVRWYAAAFLADRLTLYPGRSLVENIGADGSGTHVDSTTAFDVKLAQSPVKVSRIPLSEDHAARLAIVDYFRASQPTLLRKLKTGMQNLFAGKI